MTLYITTAIDYPNALPHIGTAFEKIAADILARYYRFKGEDVLLLLGNDENTQKVMKATLSKIEETGVVNPKVYVDEMANKFKVIWDSLDISYDDFIQTTEDRHKACVTKFIQTVYDAGFIYKKSYKSPYCNGCEEFKTAKSLVNGRCPNHPNVSIYEVEEENYFFKLSAFEHMKHDVELLPLFRKNEMAGIAFEDFSITRVNKNWGILCPFDDAQTIYVWFDALLAYLTGAGFGTDDAKFNKTWAPHMQIIGKDITRFHYIVFLAMIEAYNTKAETPIKFPRSIFSHGFIYHRRNLELIKTSKSSDSIPPTELIDKFGSDAVRYYFMSKCSLDNDSEYSLEHFEEVYNADLVNGLGNLVSRVLNMHAKFYNGGIDTSKVWINSLEYHQFCQHTAKLEYKKALELVWKIVRSANEYIETQKPWELHKTNSADGVVWHLMSCLRIIGILLKCYLPKTSDKLCLIYTVEASNELMEKIAYDNYLDLHVSQQNIGHLFPRKK